MRTIDVNVVRAGLLDIQNVLSDQSLPTANRVEIARSRVSSLATQIEAQAETTSSGDPSHVDHQDDPESGGSES